MNQPLHPDEVTFRLANIRAYNRYQIAAGQPGHCMTIRRLAVILAEWGADPKRARHSGREPEPSPVLAALEVAARAVAA